MKAKKISVAVLGSTGMLGQQVVKMLQTASDIFECTEFCRITGFDVTQIKFLLGNDGRLKQLKHFDVVFNCIGIVKEYAEYDRFATDWVNGIFPHLLVGFCQRLVHFSTDCVFSGINCPEGGYSVTDIPDATDRYGLSKFWGEPSAKNVLVVRSSFVGLGREQGLLYRYMRGELKEAYANWWFTGFTARALAARVIELVLREQFGLVHVANYRVSKANLLKAFARHLNKPFELPIVNHTQAIDRSLKDSTGTASLFWDDMFKGL